MTLLFAECDGEAEEQVDRALDQARRLTRAQPDLAADWSAVAYDADGAAPLQREADAALDRVLALDPQDSRAWHVKVHHVPSTDLVGIDHAFPRAHAARLSLCACVFQDYAKFMRGVGRAREARRMLERARDVIPLQIGPRAGLIQVDAAEGRIDLARRQLAEVDDLGLDPVRGAQFFVSSALWLKDYAGALAQLRRGPADVPAALTGAIEQGFGALASGNPTPPDAAAAALAVAVERCGCADPFTIRMQAALGDAPGALAAIERQVAKGRGPAMLSTIGWNPVLADVRRLPGFAPLADRVGLIRYWRTMHMRPDFCTTGAPLPPVCAAI